MKHAHKWFLQGEIFHPGPVVEQMSRNLKKFKVLVCPADPVLEKSGRGLRSVPGAMGRVTSLALGATWIGPRPVFCGAINRPRTSRP